MNAERSARLHERNAKLCALRQARRSGGLGMAPILPSRLTNPAPPPPNPLFAMVLPSLSADDLDL